MTTRSVVSATVGAGAATTTTRATTTTAARLRRRLMSFLLDRSGMTRRCAVSARHTPPQTTVSNSRGESRRLVRGVKIAGIRAIRRGDPVMDQPLWRWDATAVAAAIRTRKISSREATQAVLGRLEAVNPKLNAVTVVLAEQALAAADRADAALRRGEAPGLLHGVPVTVKENVDQEGQATANGVVAFKDVIAATDSPPVAAWRRAGAVIVGRTNTPAFSL